MTSNSYQDVRLVLQNALGLMPQEVRYTLGSEKEAFAFRHRCNRYRHALRKEEEKRHELPEGTGTSLYDSMLFTTAGPTVIIRQAIASGILSVGDEIIPLEDMEI